MMSSIFPSAPSNSVSNSLGNSHHSAGTAEINARFEDQLYVAYLQARSRGIAISSAGLLEWAQEIAISEGNFDCEEARSALTTQWLAGWCQRNNVDDVDEEGVANDEDAGDESDNAVDNNNEDEAGNLDNGEFGEDENDGNDDGEATANGSASLVLYPPPIDSPLTPSPPVSSKPVVSRNTKKQNITKASVDGTANNDIESVVGNYLSTPAPRSRLYEHMLAESAARLLMSYMTGQLGMAEDNRPENLPPDELNRILIQFFRQLHRPGMKDELYPVKVLHGVLEGLSRYLRSCGYMCDIAYESQFSEARIAFGERLMKAFEIESKQRHVANQNAISGESLGTDEVDDEEVTKKMLLDHHLRPLGSDECPPDEAMASFNKNTQKVMTWAAKNVVAFGRDRLGLSQFSRVEEMPPELLNIVLTRFFCESRKADGTEFGWNSFKSVFSNLEAYLRVHRYPLGLHDPVFRMAKQTLFNVLRPGSGSAGAGSGSNANAIGSSGTHLAGRSSGGASSGGSAALNATGGSDALSTAIRPLYHRPIEINSAEENILWSNGAFGWHSPQAINTTLYYYMRHIYGVRSGESHRRINFGDLKTMRSDEGRDEFLVYTKAAAGVDSSRLRRMWATRDDRCIVRVYKVMVAKRPPETRKPDAPLYLQPKRLRQYILENQSLDSTISPGAEDTSSEYWFTTAPLGKNALATLMREAYQSCGLDSRSDLPSGGLSNGGGANCNVYQGGNRFGPKSLVNATPHHDMDDGMLLADDENLVADMSNNSNMADDGGASSSSSRPESSSSFSHQQHVQLPVPNNAVRQFNTGPTNKPGFLISGSGTSFMRNKQYNPSTAPPQSQAMDLASPNNRKRDNLGRFMGPGLGTTSSGNSSSGAHEVLSLTKKPDLTSRSRLPPSGDLSVRSKPTPSKCQNGDMYVKPEPNSAKSARLDQNNDSSSMAGGVTGALSATAFGASGVGNMSISMQPQSSADMADVVGFLNQFLNSLNSTNNTSVYKCNINVTVNISK